MAGDAEAVRAAVIRGRLSDCQRAASELEELPWLAELPRNEASGARASLAHLRETSAVPAAARALGDLARVCPACHGASPEVAERVAQRASVAAPDSEMLRHQWAADAMWWGLVGPAEELWKSGAHSLAGAPLHRPDTVGLEPLNLEVRLIARRAQRAPAPDRPALYGDLLATCARCHQALNVVRR